MSSTRTLRRRIKSVKNTAQITKAMQMVAATKMRRAQNQALSGRPYNINLGISLSRLLPEIEGSAHPLLIQNGSQTTGVVLLSTDKGLVGALNTNVIRAVTATNFSQKTFFYTIGKKGRSFIAKTGKDLKADFENPDTISFKQARLLSKLLIDSYKSGEIGQTFLIYPKFISTLRQETVKKALLPISFADLKLELEHKEESVSEFIIEPDISGLLDELLIHYLEIKIYQALLETKASEQSARMIAMKNATDNALEIVDDLKLTYNQTRQGNITSELLEITSAQAAME